MSQLPIPVVMNYGLDAEQTQKLHAFLKAHYNGSSFDSALSSTLSFSPKQKGMTQASDDITYAAVIAEARSNGWDVLLAFCLTYRKLSTPDAKTLKDEIFTDPIRLGLELLQLLIHPQITDEDVGTCYQEAMTTWSWKPALPEDMKRTKAYFAYAIMSAQEAVDPNGNHLPLRAFCEALLARPNLNNRRKVEIRAAWRSIADQLGLKEELTIGITPVEERYSVLIELQESSASLPGSPRWIRAAWLFSPRGKKLKPLDDANPNTNETEQDVAAYLGTLRERLARDSIPLDKTRFEFFVSLKSLARAIDQWIIVLEEGLPRRLGAEFPVVVRRDKRNEASRQKLTARWNPLRGAKALIPNKHVVVKGRGGKLEDHYDDFDRSPNILCLMVESPVAPCAELDEFPCITAAIIAGVPIIVWARRESPNPDLQTQFSAWNRKPPKSLPELVHGLRQSCPRADQTHLGGHVTLIFENADCWPPQTTIATEART